MNGPFTYIRADGRLYIRDSVQDSALALDAVTCVIAIFLGAQADFSLMWNIADITMGFMAIINILSLFLLGGIAINRESYGDCQGGGYKDAALFSE